MAQRTGSADPSSGENEGRRRRTWGRPTEVAVKDLKGQAPRPAEKIDPSYDEYLLLLQERNRILKKMQQKNSAQIDNEKREKGFALYVNGANSPRRSRSGKRGGRPASTTAEKSGGREGLQMASGRAIEASGDGQYAEDFEPDEPADGAVRVSFALADVPALRDSLQRSCELHQLAGLADPSTAAKPDSDPDEEIESEIVEEDIASSSRDAEDPSASVPDAPIVLELAPRGDSARGVRMPQAAQPRRVAEVIEAMRPQQQLRLLHALQRLDPSSPRAAAQHAGLAAGTGRGAGTSGGSHASESESSARTPSPAEQEQDDDPTPTPHPGQPGSHVSALPFPSLDEAPPATAVIRQAPTVTASIEEASVVAPATAVRARPSTPPREHVEAADMARGKTAVVDRPSFSRGRAPPSARVAKVELVLKSSWTEWTSGPIGLTEVQFFDTRGNTLALSPDNVVVRGATGDSGAAPGTLVNGRCRTTDPAHMWTTEFADPPAPITIVFTLPAAFALQHICIWNYNRPNCETMGARHAEILVDGNLMWVGEIKKGTGSKSKDFSHRIDMPIFPITRPAAPVEARADRARALAGPAAGSLPDLPASSAAPTELSAVSSLGLPPTQPRAASVSDVSAPSVESGARTEAVPLWLQQRPSSARPASQPSRQEHVDPAFVRPSSRQQTSHGRRSAAASRGSVKDDKDFLASATPRARLSEPSGPAGPASDVLATIRPSHRTPVDPAPQQPAISVRSSSTAALRPDIEDSLTAFTAKRASNAAAVRLQAPALAPAAAPVPAAAEGPRRARWQKRQTIEESFDSLAIFKSTQAGRLGVPSAEPEPDPEPDTEPGPAGNGAEFRMPVLPSGQELVVNITSTWGDTHYVGLTGIQIFAATGEEITDFHAIRADPPDINVLPGVRNDPRVVGNLLDGVNLTCDETHMWLAPFCRGTDHRVFVTFARPQQIAVIRIWNYNESRIHSQRGARDVSISLDGRLIFKGEIARGAGVITADQSSFGELLLFTTDPALLAAIAQRDAALIAEQQAAEALPQMPLPARPGTAGPRAEGLGGSVFDSLSDMPLCDSTLEVVRAARRTGAWTGRVLQLNFTHTWGDKWYLGLTGLEVLGPDGPLPLHVSQMDADPRDLNAQGGSDVRTLDKLVDGVNLTVQDNHMWMVPFTADGQHWLTIDLQSVQPVKGIRVWNYNKSVEDSTRGARIVHVFLDDHEVSPPAGYVLRRAPGSAAFDFGQTILFDAGTPSAPSRPASAVPAAVDRLIPDYVVALEPQGFVVSLHLFTTCGDPHYIGLNGIELLDNNGRPIAVRPSQVLCTPRSVADLPGCQHDVRTPDKLVDGVNNTFDDRHMWLAPWNPGQTAKVELYFDTLITLGALRLWNYAKTPARGVRHLQVRVDDRIVYDGMLKPARAGSVAANAPFMTSCEDTHHTIIFSDCESIIAAERPFLLSYTDVMREEPRLSNDGKIMSTGRSVEPAYDASVPRPKTMVTGGRNRF